MAVTACWRCCRARLAATGDSVAVRVLACSAPSLKFLKSSGEADLEGLRILSAQGTKDGLGVDDDHVKEEEDLPVPDLVAPSRRVVARYLITNVDTLHPDVIILYSGMDVALADQGRQPSCCYGNRHHPSSSHSSPWA